MAVDLSDLLPRLEVEINPPGVDLYPDSTPEILTLHMVSGFWEAVLDGIITGYESNEDGIVTPTTEGGDDLSQELQQLVIFYAGMKIIRNYLINVKTLIHNVAGPVEQQIQQSANMMRDILADMKDRKKILLERLSDLGVSNTYYVDAVIARDSSVAYGDTWWVRESGHQPSWW